MLILLSPSQRRDEAPATDKIRVVQRAPVSTAAAPSISRPPVAVQTDNAMIEAAEYLPDDPALKAGLIPKEFDPASLYRAVRAEPRDRVWAARSEASVRAALAAIPNVPGGEALRVSCASTLCEVRGGIADGISQDDANVAALALQGDPLRRPVEAAGLTPHAATFGGAGRGLPFTLYLKRR